MADFADTIAVSEAARLNRRFALFGVAASAAALATPAAAAISTRKHPRLLLAEAVNALDAAARAHDPTIKGMTVMNDFGTGGLGSVTFHRTVMGGRTAASPDQRIEAAIEEITFALAEKYPGRRIEMFNRAWKDRHAIFFFAPDETQYPQKAGVAFG